MNRDCGESEREDRIPVAGPARKKARSLRMMYYAVYVAALLLAEGLIGAVVASSADGEASLLAYTIGAAAMMLPLVILQLTVAALAVKAPSLRRLLVLTVAFGIGAGLLSLAFMHVPQGWQRWLRWLPLGGLLGGPLFHLMPPVLILWLLQRRQPASGAKLREDGTLAVDHETPSGAPMEEMRLVHTEEPGRPWYRWDVAMAVVPLSFAVLLDPLGVFN